jgi:hypothetical protein
MATDHTIKRVAALAIAALLDPPHCETPVEAAREIRHAADVLYVWLTRHGPVATFTITADPPVDRPTHGGNPMSLTFPDGQQDTLRVGSIADDRGEAVTDTFTWTVDNGDVLVLTVSDDTQSCLVVPGTVAGSAVVTATADSDGVSRTFAIDVTTGPVATFEITSDGPVDRPADEPAPEPTA